MAIDVVASLDTAAGAHRDEDRGPLATERSRIRTWPGVVRASLRSAVGDVAFGMEDGAVSIAGLVFGVAAATDDPHVVLLAGAAGAAAGAVSMMAGTYLDVLSVRDRGRAARDDARRRVSDDPAGHARRAEAYFRGLGFTETEARTTAAALRRHPEALLEHVAAHELGLGPEVQASPWAHAGWMFIADLIAAATPVIPFALLAIEPARVVSLVLTTVLLIALGLGRARITRQGVLASTVQTLVIAAGAAAAGIIIGQLLVG